MTGLGIILAIMFVGVAGADAVRRLPTSGFSIVLLFAAIACGILGALP